MTKIIPLNRLPQGPNEDPIKGDAETLVSLIPTVETLNRAFGFSGAESVSEDMLREAAYKIRNNDRAFGNLKLTLSRKYRLALLASIVSWKSEALKRPEFFVGMLDECNIDVSKNTCVEQARNAAVVRLLTQSPDGKNEDKWDVSRNAAAIRGIEIICNDNGLTPTFGNADVILKLIDGYTRTSLIALASKSTTPEVMDDASVQGEPEAAGPAPEHGPVEEPAQAPVPTASTPAKVSAPKTPACKPAKQNGVSRTPCFSLPAPSDAKPDELYISRLEGERLVSYGPVTSATAAALIASLGL